MSYIYLASPYSDDDPLTIHERYTSAQDALAWLTKMKVWTYSPIVHFHHMALAHNFPKDANFWSDCNLAMLEKAYGLYILTLPRWQESKGVRQEMAWAKKLDMPITLLTQQAMTYPPVFSLNRLTHFPVFE